MSDDTLAQLHRKSSDQEPRAAGLKKRVLAAVLDNALLTLVSLPLWVVLPHAVPTDELPLRPSRLALLLTVGVVGVYRLIAVGARGGSIGQRTAGLGPQHPVNEPAELGPNA